MSKRVLSHLAHVELLTPKLDESAAFFTGTLGLVETARAVTTPFTCAVGASSITIVSYLRRQNSQLSAMLPGAAKGPTSSLRRFRASRPAAFGASGAMLRSATVALTGSAAPEGILTNSFGKWSAILLRPNCRRRFRSGRSA